MAHIESKLSKILGERRMSIRELATTAGIAYGTAHALYHHSNKQIHYGVLAAVCAALGVGVGDVLEVVPDAE